MRLNRNELVGPGPDGSGLRREARLQKTMSRNYCDYLDFIIFIPGMDEYAAGPSLQKKICACVTKPQASNCELRNAVRKVGMVEDNTIVLGLYGNAQACLKNEERCRRCPRLGRASHRIKGRALAIPSLQPAEQLRQTMKLDHAAQIE